VNTLLADLRSLLPKPLRRWLIRHSRLPRVGTIDAGDLRRLKPFSTVWGNDRGSPIDRFYVDAFLQRYSADVHGRVLEVGDDSYTRRFGGTRVESSEVLHAAPGNPLATYVADLTDAPQLPSLAFDCMICTQTLFVVNDLRAAFSTIHRILKPGGVLLATFPGISQIYTDEQGLWPDYWRFTLDSVRWLASHDFAPSDVLAHSYGNVWTATAFLYGIAAEELAREELEYRDEAYQLLVGLRAVKESGSTAS
jgi:SAM-dependent methyltransferase